MRTAVGTALAALLLGALAEGAAAQERTVGNFTVTPVLGVIRWDDASALANKEANDAGAFTETVITPTVGLAAEYNVWRQLAAGFYFEAARAQTRGDYFPALLLNFGSRADLRSVSQRVTVFMYGAQASFAFDVGRFHPYVSGGGGSVTVNGDPQQNDDNASFSGGQFQLGGGLGFRLGANTTLRLDVRDYVFTGWDRDRLNPVDPAYQNQTFPSANISPPDEKSTVHNLRFAVGFSYVPRRGAATDEGTAQPADQED